MRSSRIPVETRTTVPGGPTERPSRTLRTVRSTGQPPAPTVLDRYRLHRRLGTGAFGTVWMARDERLERDVAVKVLARERVEGGRFEREARVAARLTHPGIVTLYEAAVDDEGAYLVSELVRGETLGALLEAGRLSDRDIVEIGIVLCDALHHAHEQGVVHRDVKPSNVLVPEQPSSPAQLAKLTDFGVARVIGGVGDPLTMTGDVIGTLAYMAPEQAEGRPAGASADLYSLALVLYEAFTGVNPVRTSTAAAHARRLGAHLPPLRRQRRDLPRELGQGLDLALRPRPSERGTVTQLRAALLAAREQVADEPGIVTAPWARGTQTVESPVADAFGDQSPPVPEAGDAPLGEHQRPARASFAALPWFGRGMAAVGAAATAAALSADLLAPAPVPPALAGLIAGGLTLILPRIGWLGLACAAAGIAVAQGHPGAALMVALAMLIPVVALPWRPTAWPLAIAAPILGLAGVAGAWPALSARAGTALRRAALGATGWVWLLLVAPITDRTLYLPRLPGTPPSGVWVGSAYDTVHHVLGPLVSAGVLAPAAIWALGAAILPWLTGGRWFALDVVRVLIWTAAVVGATGAALAAAGGQGLPSAPTAVLGAVAAGLVALARPGLVAWRGARYWSGSEAGIP